jgi:hypothetical protein
MHRRTSRCCGARVASRSATAHSCSPIGLAPASRCDAPGF